MMQDDFEKLMKRFQVSDPSQINMEEIMREVLNFFGGLKREIIDASPEEGEKTFSNLTTRDKKIMILEREFDRCFCSIAVPSSGKIEASKLLEEWKLFLERLGKELPEAS